MCDFVTYIHFIRKYRRQVVGGVSQKLSAYFFFRKMEENDETL